MNRPLRRVAIACLVMLVLLLGSVNYWQVGRADGLNAREGNRRAIIADYARARGPILVGDTEIAFSEDTGGELKYQRVYADGPMWAPATGYFSQTFGRSGIERAENDYLAGTADEFFVERLVDLVTNKTPEGGTVRLTLNSRAQQAAWEAMEGRRGAVVALNPQTGAILAMVSTPSYDPNTLATHDPNAERDAKEALDEDPDSPLENRAIQRHYFPGSTFKVITAAAALSSGYTAQTMVPAPPELDLPQTTATISNYDGEACGADNQTSLANALRISCNTAFASVGLDLGDDILRAQAEAFGFGRDIDIPMQAAVSRFPDDINAPQTAQSAIGQFEVQLTALQNAMVAAAVANGGEVMSPYLVEEILAPDLSVVGAADPRTLSQAITPQVAGELATMMVDVVDNGTGTRGAISGVRVAGKTGTAQRGEGERPDAWFIAVDADDDPQVAVAVIVEGGAEDASDISGGRQAAPIAKSVMEAVLGL